VTGSPNLPSKWLSNLVIALIRAPDRVSTSNPTVYDCPVRVLLA
jgi:hypothetical protein